MKIIIIFLLMFVANIAQAQKTFKGKVSDSNNQGLPGVIVYFENQIQNAALSNDMGEFSVPYSGEAKRLIFKLIGYQTDTLIIQNNSEVRFVMKPSNQQLDEIVISGNSTVIDRLSPIQTEILTAKTLAKAACCNLSESFETNASVSVNYADAVTGAKQIQLLGLSGVYIQTNLENIPNLRGLATTFGLNYLPGTWIQSIDLGKGVGSVVNGYENMTGVINVELKKPEASEKVLLNMYANHLGRGEVNLNLSKKINTKWSTGFMGHYSLLKTKIDNNGDTFLDLPKYDQINVLNRWKYSGEKLMSQFGFRIMKENRVGGQTNFESNEKTPSIYGFTNTTTKFDFFSKTALLFPKTPYRGLGLIINATGYDSESMFGFKPYLGVQNTLYTNLIYQDKIIDTRHTYKAGFSFLVDQYNEKYTGITRERNESVPGAFFEYTFNHLDRTMVLIGMRSDFHNLYGTKFSPRIHFKQDIGQNDTWRVSAGKGFRVPNPLAEYYGNLVSNRSVVFMEELLPEEAVNVGTSYVKEIGKFTISGEYYYTYFLNQLIADMEHSRHIYFYNLDGKSTAQSGLIEVNYGPKNRWEYKLAYRFTTAKQTMGKPGNENVVVDRMFLPRDRVLANIAYALPYDKWKFDFTWQWNGKRRLPEFRPGAIMDSYKNMKIIYGPSFSNINAQVSRNFPKLEVYLGGENIGNFRQKDPIIGYQNPFGATFDAGMAWGPVVGAIVYSGFRYKIQ
jgi:hypothetical protein